VEWAQPTLIATAAVIRILRIVISIAAGIQSLK
jgi:hypothetical protein